MRALTVLYHDVVAQDFDESGFPGSAAGRYKFRRDEFSAHIAAIARRAAAPARAIDPFNPSFDGRPFFLTFDDGGASSVYCAEEIEKFGFRASFFVTTDRIGTPGFMSSDDIRWVRKRGHDIGSHSSSHPYRIADLPDDQLLGEWRRSIDALSEILKEPVATASVPGGFFSRRVAQSARKAGIRVLFNSEPTTAVMRIDDCFVIGRFNVYRGMTAEAAGDLAAGRASALLKQKLTWNAKKTIKTVAAPVWDRMRDIAFRRPTGA